MDREVLGVRSFPERARLSIIGSKQTGWRINGGSLNGITPSSILAVFPPAGEAKADQPIGHVKVLEAAFHPLEAAIEPCEFEGMPAPGELVAGMRCQAVYVDLGDSRLRLHVDQQTDAVERLLENPRVFVELPAREVVAETGIVMILAATLHESDPAATKIVIERMSRAERFVFLQLPTRLKPADIVRDVSGEESVFLPLNFLLQTLAVVRKRWSFRECDTCAKQQNQRGGHG